MDCLQLHTPFATKLPLLDTYYEMNKLVEKGKVRYLGISNTTLEQLQNVQNNFKLFNFEGIYNLECKLYEKLNVLKYCTANDIDFLCYQPLRRNRTAKRNYPFLVELANKYNKTQNQIILNWIIKEKGLKTILKATSIENIQENLLSLDFSLKQEDIEQLNNFVSKEFDSVIIDWEDKGGIPIHQLANQFE